MVLYTAFHRLQYHLRLKLCYCCDFKSIQFEYFLLLSLQVTLKVFTYTHEYERIKLGEIQTSLTKKLMILIVG